MGMTISGRDRTNVLVRAVAKRRIIAKNLLLWSKKKSSAYPWRKNPSPYDILVSELLLRKTRADQVSKVFPVFVRQFPTVKDLALSPPEKIRKTIYSLGRLKRDEQIRQIALKIMQKHSGLLPRSEKELFSILGKQSRYTVNAIRCFAFGEKVPVFDVNVNRILTVVAEYGDSYFELLQSLIGMVASKKYYSSQALAYLGTIDNLRENVYEAFLDIKHKIRLPITLSDHISNSFDFALSSMFPMIIIDNQNLFYVHPLILGFLKKWNLVSQDDKSIKETITRAVKLLEKVQEGTYMKIYLSEEADYFQKRGIPKHNFISDLGRIGRLINMTKLVNTTWTQQNDKAA